MTSDLPKLSREQKFLVFGGLLLGWEWYLACIFVTIAAWVVVGLLLIAGPLDLDIGAPSEQIPGYLLGIGICALLLTTLTYVATRYIFVVPFLTPKRRRKTESILALVFQHSKAPVWLYWAFGITFLLTALIIALFGVFLPSLEMHLVVTLYQIYFLRWEI